MKTSLRSGTESLAGVVFAWLNRRVAEDLMALINRLEENIEVLPDGCWLYKKGYQPNGYCRISIVQDRRHYKVYAHHVFWVLRNWRQMPHYMEIDHICGTRGCVNPGHLECVTREENLRRRDVRHRNN